MHTLFALIVFIDSIPLEFLNNFVKSLQFCQKESFFVQNLDEGSLLVCIHECLYEMSLYKHADERVHFFVYRTP